MWIDKKISKEIIKYAIEEAKRRNISDINYINKIVESCLEKIRLNKEKTNQDLPIWFDKKIEKNKGLAVDGNVGKATHKELIK